MRNCTLGNCMYLHTVYEHGANIQSHVSNEDLTVLVLKRFNRKIIYIEINK